MDDVDEVRKDGVDVESESGVGVDDVAYGR